MTGPAVLLWMPVLGQAQPDTPWISAAIAVVLVVSVMVASLMTSKRTHRD